MQQERAPPNERTIHSRQRSLPFIHAGTTVKQEHLPSLYQLAASLYETRVRFIFLHSGLPPHDARKGRHYYRRRLLRPRYSSIVVTPLGGVMEVEQRHFLQKKELHPETLSKTHSYTCPYRRV